MKRKGKKRQPEGILLTIFVSVTDIIVNPRRRKRRVRLKRKKLQQQLL
jgi:hypothetical protein